MYEHRKSEKRVILKGSDGQPLAGQNVSVELKNHRFLFGCGAFDFLKAGENDAFYDRRMELWQEIFNYGTLPFYLGAFEPVEGRPETESRMNAAKFLKERHITAKGHPLCWHTAWADWLMDYDDKTVMEKVLKRIEREVTAFRGVIDMWDVINEVVIMPIFDKYDNAITRLCKRYGRISLVKEVFGAAHAANPDATLLINDFNLSESYDILIDGCLHAGVPISAIGIQSHQHQGYRGDAYFEDVLDRFSRFGLPLHFTENTLVSGSLIPDYIVDLNDWQVDSWPTTPEFEERQKNELEHMYRMLFDCPRVEAITNWDFADGAWLKAPSGFIREDLTKKPSFDMLKKLIREEWHTAYETVTDEFGGFTLSGFKGDYDIVCGGLATTEKLD